MAVRQAGPTPKNNKLAASSLILALSATFCSFYAIGGPAGFSTDFSNESNIVGISFFIIAMGALLGAIRWGIKSTQKEVNKAFGFLLECTEAATLPFLALNLIEQSYVPTGIIWLVAHAIYIASLTVGIDAQSKSNLSKGLHYAATIALGVQAFQEQDMWKGGVVAVLLGAPIILDKYGLMYYQGLMAVLCVLMECTRNGGALVLLSLYNKK